MSDDPRQCLIDAFGRAIVAAFGDDFAGSDPVIRAASKPELGDFQCNAAMPLGKRIGRPPREVAQELLNAVDLGDLVESTDIAGPGFINIRLRNEALTTALTAMDGPNLGITPAPDPETVVIDMCGVNVAKQMHVGHLRSTIIGDAFARMFTRLGHDVHRENHLGDWGLPIAMVIQVLLDRGADFNTLTLSHLDSAYREAQSIARSDAAGIEAAHARHSGPHRVAELEAQNEGASEFRDRAGRTLVSLQQGDEVLVARWKSLIDITQAAMAEALDLLNVDMSSDDNRGESTYRDLLEGVISTFESGGFSRVDEGALVVDFPDRDRPLLIRKSDGGYLYATTDLAAIRVRTQNTRAMRCIYVVDARQRDHFRDVFDAARIVGWNQIDGDRVVELTHTGFGSVLGPDRKPLKTRSGDNVTLSSLLQEAIERGCTEVRNRSSQPTSQTHGLSDAELDRIGRAVGIGAIKYADLSNDLVKDYVFDLDRMVAFEGDTGPYLQYAHARIQSILRRASGDWSQASILVDTPQERDLTLALLAWNQTVRTAARVLEPHRIAAYLRELAERFNAFYQACRVLKADRDDVRDSRLRLCDLTGRVLADGLDLLGIESPDRM